jgi:hypothetical protein
MPRAVFENFSTLANLTFADSTVLAPEMTLYHENYIHRQVESAIPNRADDQTIPAEV